MLVGGILLILAAAMFGEFRGFHTWDVSARAWLALLYLIVAVSIIAFTAYVWLIARDPTTRVASYAYVNPLIALLLGSLLAHERPSPVQYAGAALVVAGVASTIAGKRVMRREPAEKVA